MIGALLSGECTIYDPSTNSWSPGGGQAVRTNEETWILLADHTILTVECFPPFHSQKYIISSNTWKDGSRAGDAGRSRYERNRSGDADV